MGMGVGAGNLQGCADGMPIHEYSYINDFSYAVTKAILQKQSKDRRIGFGSQIKGLDYDGGECVCVGDQF